MNSNIILSDYNRKSKEGSLILVVTEDMRIVLLNSENLTPLRVINNFNYAKLHIKENSRIMSVNFSLLDTIFLGFSDGSVIKSKFNDDPVNLRIKNNSTYLRTYDNNEDEFENLKSVFSSDKINYQESNISNNNYSEMQSDNPVQYLTTSLTYKILFATHKVSATTNNIDLFCLRNSTIYRTFCTLEGTINCLSVNENRSLILIVTYHFDTKQTILEIWSFNEPLCPISVYNLSKLMDYTFTVKVIKIVSMPNKYYGRNSKYGQVDGDIIILGTTKGDVIVGKISNSIINSKPGFELLYIYKLKNSSNSGNEVSNQFEVTFIDYDLFFDILLLGDMSSNVRIFEKMLQIGKIPSNEENLPFFSLFYESEKPSHLKPYKFEIDSHLPIISVHHDVLKDRSVIMYDQGTDLIMTNDESLEELDVYNETKL